MNSLGMNLDLMGQAEESLLHLILAPSNPQKHTHLIPHKSYTIMFIVD